MSESLLKVRNITAGYGGNDVLNDVSLSVSSGHISGVIGPNGSGKTTLLRSIFGLIPLKRGRVEFEGQNISSFTVRERLQLGIACVPQERNVFANLNVVENLEIAFAAIPRNASLKRQIDLVFSLFPRLQERQQQIAGSMSGGEQRMVAIGIGLMTTPRLLLLDEPTTGLAPQVVHQLMRAIKILNEEHAISAVVVEQNILSLLKIVDAIEIVKTGTVTRFEGKPESLANQNVWEFL